MVGQEHKETSKTPVKVTKTQVEHKQNTNGIKGKVRVKVLQFESELTKLEATCHS